MYHFLPSISYPPSTTINIRGGYLYAGPGMGNPGQARIYDDYALDLAGADSPLSHSFTTADAYLGILLCIDAASGWDDGEWQFAVYGDSEEHTTKEDAEDYAWGLFTSSTVWLGKLPVCLLIIRNNGITGTPHDILPIDAVNRQRSYLWMDVRPTSSFGQ